MSNIYQKDIKHIGLLSAMPEEVGFIIDNLTSVNSFRFGDIEIFSGELVINSKKINITTAWSGWGKVSAARATTRIISINSGNNPIDLLIFTGVAGGVDLDLKQWDIVIADSIIQHDMDARPLFKRYVIPSIGNDKVIPNQFLIEEIFKFLKKTINKDRFKIFGSIHKGLIATGDNFIAESNKIKKLSEEIPGLLAVEMEGAAFAQVADQENVPWVVMRVISDSADENADSEFSEFLEKYKFKAFDLIKQILEIIIDFKFKN